MARKVRSAIFSRLGVASLADAQANDELGLAVSVHQLFSVLDRNGNGSLDKREFRAGLQRITSATSYQLTDADYDAAWSEIDVDEVCTSTTASSDSFEFLMDL